MLKDKLLKITNIKHAQNQETRTDGGYPLRIGCTFIFEYEPEIGKCALLFYRKDNRGETKDSVLRTSTVEKITETRYGAEITTKNSIYELEYVK